MQEISVGRSPQNNVVIHDPKVSNLHLRLRKEDDGRYFVVDLKSTNGSFVNGKRIQGESPITPGDQLQIGNTVLPWESYFKDDDGGGATVVGATASGWNTLTIVLTAMGGFVGLIITILFVLNVAGVYHKKHAHITVDSLEIYEYEEYVNDSLTRRVLVQNLLDSLDRERKLGVGIKKCDGKIGKGEKMESKSKDSVIVATPISEDSPLEQEDNYVFYVVEETPEFPGGERALIEFLDRNIRYPAIAQENGSQGRVRCQFTVERDGSISDVEVVKSAGDPSLDKEAIRVIKSMPMWSPGKQRGKPVRVSYTLYINFRLQ